MKDLCSWWGAWKERWNWQVLSAFRGNGCSAGSLSSLPSKGGDRATLEELRLRAEAYARVEHRGSTLWPAHTERERAQPAGRERPRRRLFVGFACRGLPQGAPRMTLPLVLPPPLISFSLSLSPCPTFLGKIRKEDNFVINNSRERSCDYISNSRKKIESIPDEIHVYIYIYFSPSLVDSPIRWFAGDGSIFVSKISRNRRFVWHYSLSLSPTVSLSLLRVDKPSSGCEKKIRMHAWKFDSFDLIFLELSIGEEGKIGSVFTYPIILYNTWL